MIRRETEEEKLLSFSCTKMGLAVIIFPLFNL